MENQTSKRNTVNFKVTEYTRSRRGKLRLPLPHFKIKMISDVLDSSPCTQGSEVDVEICNHTYMAISYIEKTLDLCRRKKLPTFEYDNS